MNGNYYFWTVLIAAIVIYSISNNGCGCILIIYISIAI